MYEGISKWLVLNENHIKKILNECVIYDFKGSDGEINIKEIIRIIKGSVEEIKKLSCIIENLKNNK